MAIVSPTTLVVRTWDALRAFFAVLFGTRTLRSIEPISALRKNAEIANALLEVSNVLEKLNAWSARQNQREAREARKQLASGEETGQPPAPLTVKDRKALLRARRRAQRFGAQVELNLPPPLSAPILKTPDELTPEEGDGDVSSNQGGQD